MNDAMASLLDHRAKAGSGLRRTLVVSTAVHAAGLAVAILTPGAWLAGQADAPSPNVMTLRLGGPEGPDSGGRVPIGGRPVQQIVSLPEARRPQWIQPPSPAPPEMVLPVPESEPSPRLEPETEVETAPEEARGRTPTTGAELREGTAMAETGTQGPGIGLSTGGLGGRGTELDVGDFCCPEYLARMLNLIGRRWDDNQGVRGTVVVRFTIRRDGSIVDVGLARASGRVALDLSAQRAVLLTRTIGPLPSAFPEPSLTVSLTFEYQP